MKSPGRKEKRNPSREIFGTHDEVVSHVDKLMAQDAHEKAMLERGGEFCF